MHFRGRYITTSLTIWRKTWRVGRCPRAAILPSISRRAAEDHITIWVDAPMVFIMLHLKATGGYKQSHRSTPSSYANMKSAIGYVSWTSARSCIVPQQSFPVASSFSCLLRQMHL